MASCARECLAGRAAGGAEAAGAWLCFSGGEFWLPLLFVAGVGFGFAFPFPLLVGRRLNGALAVCAGRFCVGVVVVFFGVGAGGGVAVETARLRCTRRSGVAERARLSPNEDRMLHLAALPAVAISCFWERSEAPVARLSY